MTLADIESAVGGRLRNVADPAVVVTDVVVDSREVTPGALFVALPGTRTDGLSFVDDAMSAGAAAALVAADVNTPSIVVDDVLVAFGKVAGSVLAALPDLRVVGITGSNGKTTTKDLVAAVLSNCGPTVAAPASYNGEVGLPLSVFRVEAATRYLVLEYGARGVGHIRDLTGIARPDIGVVLGVGVAHVGVFGSVDAIATAKGELVEALPADGLAVLNADDARVLAMRERTKARVRTFGRNADADVRAHDVTLDDKGRAGFTLSADGGTAHVQLQLYGEHQVTNALAAATVALEAGMLPEAVAAALSVAAPTSRWRMEVAETGDGVTLINDAYNANPDSMAAGLRALVTLAGGRRSWAVLGPMAELGDTGPEAHRTVGRLARDLGVHRVVVVGEAASPIAETADGSATTVDVVADVAGAVALLRASVEPGDVVLVKASRSAGLERVAEALTAGTVPA